MKTTASDYPATVHVKVMLRNPADGRMLAEALHESGMTVERTTEIADGSDDIDLIVVDPHALDASGDTILRIRQDAHPMVAPVLLVASKSEGRQGWIQRELGHRVDDVVELPTTGPILQARVWNLLQLGTLSRMQARQTRQTQQRLDGVNRALKTLNACNEVMLRESTEDGLIASVCQVITQAEGYALAWVGFLDAPGGDPDVVAIRCASGVAASYTDAVAVRADDTPEGNGPAGRAIKTGSTQVIGSMVDEPSLAPWHEQITRWGLGATIALPLRPRQGPRGVLAVCSYAFDDFGHQECALLERLADNLTFGIDSLRTHREREAQSEKVRQLAYSDALTQLPNRRSLLEWLEHVIGGAGRDHVAAILFIDLDGFKLINDALGHTAGDEVLLTMARRIQRSLRSTDLVARQGGDEFIVVMIDNPRQPTDPDLSAEARLARNAQGLAERILAALRQPLHVRGHGHRLTASVGISLLYSQSNDAETAIDHADMAMYAAKGTNEPIRFYSSEIGSHRQQRLALESRLHHAFENEAFQLHYQPIWNIETGQIVAVEALLRWQDTDGQQISPGTFIPVAEEIGLLQPIGEWVITEASQQLTQWRAAGLDLSVSINLSASQLQGLDAAQRISEQFAPHGADPRHLILELTEETLMHSPAEATAAMQELSEAGFRFALDDFGRGYSSLARLHHLPLDTLKIDKLFVDGLGGSHTDGRLVRAIIGLARELSLSVVAEGIETPEQEHALAAMHCDRGQGFLLSPALPPDQIPPLVVTGKR